MKLRRLHSLLLALLVTVPSAATALDIPLTVRNDLDQARSGAMVQVGVPFAMGALSSPEALRLDGVPYLETKVLSTWYDESPRWVLLTFPADVPARGTAVYRLSDAGDGAEDSPLSAVDDGSVITVETGRLRFTVDKTTFRVLNSASMDGDGDGTYETEVVRPGQSEGLVMEGTDGRLYTGYAAAPDVAEIEDMGPWSVTLHFEGDLAPVGGGEALVRYVTRITAWANSAELRVQQTLHNPRAGSLDYGGPGAVFFQSAGIELATPFATGQVRAGGDAGDPALSATLAAGGRAYLHQDSSGLDSWNKHGDLKNTTFRGWRFYAGAEGAESQLGQGDQAAGWMELGDGVRGAAMGIDEFWQLFPNALVSRGDGRIQAEIFSRFQAGDHTLRAATQKTHKLRIRFSADGGAGTAAAMGSALHPLLALAPPQYYLSTGCLRRTVPAAGSPAPQYELFQQAGLYGGVGYNADDPKASAAGNKAFDDVYGWWDYGDFWAEYEHEGDRANLENDYSHGMILQMLRSGNFDYWPHISSGARHLADIDIYHTDQDALEWRNGGFFEHDRTGTGRHKFDYPQPGHYNAQGMFHYYYLTGDPIVRDSALEVANSVAWRLSHDGGYGGFSGVAVDAEIRSAAWFLFIANEAWKCTRDPKFLVAAQDVVNRAHADQRCWIDGPGNCAPGEFVPEWYTKINTWQVGMLMTAVGEYLQEYVAANGAPDPRAVTSLQMYGDWLQDFCWSPENARFADGWNHDDGSITISAPLLNYRIIDGLVNAWRWTGDDRMLLHVDTAWQTANRDPWYDNSGISYTNMKDHAVAARNGGAYLEVLAEGGGGPTTCMRVVSTNPDDGQTFDPSGAVLFIFSEAVDGAGLQGQIQAEGSVSGPLDLSVEANLTVASVSLQDAPQAGETVTFTVLPGAVSVEGRYIDGNADGDCGDAYTLQLEAGASGPVDQVPPAAVEDLELVFGQNGVALARWTAPADQGPTGKPSQVQVRYRTDDPTQPFDWSTATEVEVNPLPSDPGSLQTFELGAIDASDGALRVAVRTVDDAGNVSPSSNVAQDEFGPQCLVTGTSPLLLVEGSVASAEILVADANSGRARVLRARFALDDRALWQGDSVDVSYPLSLPPYLGMARIPVDASSWVAGEEHVLVVEGLDAAANWSGEPLRLPIQVIAAETAACLGLVQAQPSGGSVVPHFSGFTLYFNQALDPSTVDASAFDLSFTPQNGGSARTVAVEISANGSQELVVGPAESIVENGEFRLEISSSLSSADGDPLGVGSACEPLPALVVRQDAQTALGGCMALTSISPPVGTSVARLDEVRLTFDEAVLPTSVNDGTVEVELRRGDGSRALLAVDFVWTSDREVRVRLSPAVEEPAEVRVRLHPGIVSTTGAALGEGSDCLPLEEMRIFVRQGAEGLDSASELAGKDRAALIAVTGYQVVFSELEPGATLRIFDTSGYLLHQARIDGSQYVLDTSTLGSFPDKQLIVVYRDKKQHILVGRNVDFYRSYIGEVE